MKLLVHLPQGDLAKQQDASIVLPGSKAVVGRLGGHVCKVDTFSKHISSYWGFRRSNSEPLA